MVFYILIDFCRRFWLMVSLRKNSGILMRKRFKKYGIKNVFVNEK